MYVQITPSLSLSFSLCKRASMHVSKYIICDMYMYYRQKIIYVYIERGKYVYMCMYIHIYTLTGDWCHRYCLAEVIVVKTLRKYHNTITREAQARKAMASIHVAIHPKKGHRSGIGRAI